MKNNRLIKFLFYFFLIVCIVFLILDFMSIIKIDNAIKGGIFLITLTEIIMRRKLHLNYGSGGDSRFFIFALGSGYIFG